MKREKLTRIEVLRLVQILMKRTEQYSEEIRTDETMNENEKALMQCFNEARHATLEELSSLIINNIHPRELGSTEIFFSEELKA